MTFDVCNWLLMFSIEFTQSTWFTTIKSIGKNFQKNSWKLFQLTFILQLTLVNCTWSGPYWRPHISTWALLHTYSCQLVEETPQFISLLLPFGKLLCLHSVNIFVFFHWNMYNDFSFFYFSGKRTNLKYFGQYSNILPSNNIQGILTMPHLHPTFW